MITFKNIELINYLKAKLNQAEDVFDENELLNIEELHLNTKNFADEYNVVDIDELKYFKNLKILELSNIFIDDECIKIFSTLSKLEEISFVGCSFGDSIDLKFLHIEKLSINNCVITDDSFIYEMKYLKELTLVKSFLNFSKLNKFYLLKCLNLASSTCVKVDDINLPSLEELVLDYSNITDLKFILKLNNLKRLSLSRDQIKDNKEIVNLILKKDVQVYENNIIKIEEVQ